MTAVTAWEQPVLAFMLAMPRVLAALLVLPAFNQELISGLARSAVVSSLALVAAPMVAAELPPDGLAPARLGAIILKELFVGFALGYVAAVFIWAVTAGGELIDAQRGIGALGGGDTAGEDTSLPLGRLARVTVTTLFVLGGGLTVFLDGLYGSYRTWPVTAFFPHLGPELAAFFLDQLDLLMRVALLIAAPAVLMLFIVDVATGLIARVMPQLNAFMLGLPVKSAVATLGLALYVVLLLGFFREQMRVGLDATSALVDVLR